MNTEVTRNFMSISFLLDSNKRSLQLHILLGFFIIKLNLAISYR